MGLGELGALDERDEFVAHGAWRRAFAMATKLMGGEVPLSEDAFGMIEDSLDELQTEVNELELLDFLAADLYPVPADPVFKQELCDMLWEMVASGSLPKPRKH